jgi:hypothetical protein
MIDESRLRLERRHSRKLREEWYYAPTPDKEMSDKL